MLSFFLPVYVLHWLRISRFWRPSKAKKTIGCNKIDACWMGACVVNQEQLISPNHKMVLLAALSDSLDYMSESVQQYVPEPKISCWKNAYVMSRGKQL
jgi:hypothetical protein